MRINKIIKKSKYSKIFININNKIIDLEIRDLNIYNVLASVAVLKELDLKLPLLEEEKINLMHNYLLCNKQIDLLWPILQHQQY